MSAITAPRNPSIDDPDLKGPIQVDIDLVAATLASGLVIQFTTEPDGQMYFNTRNLAIARPDLLAAMEGEGRQRALQILAALGTSVKDAIFLALLRRQNPKLDNPQPAANPPHALHLFSSSDTRH